MYELKWYKKAYKQYFNIEDKKLLRKINELINDILKNGYNAKLGKVELLKSNYSGYASVRIDKKNRIIFKITENEVLIVSCKGHYDDH